MLTASGPSYPIRHPNLHPQGFSCDRHTVHLGRVGLGGSYIVQVTEDSVHLVEPAGLLPACSWHPSSSSFKAQHAATAGVVIAVASESTMVLLALEAPTTRQATCGAGKTSKANRAALNEVYRLRIDDGPVSALGMRSLGNTAKDEEGGGGAEEGGGGGGGESRNTPIAFQKSANYVEFFYRGWVFFSRGRIRCWREVPNFSLLMLYTLLFVYMYASYPRTVHTHQ